MPGSPHELCDTARVILDEEEYERWLDASRSATRVAALTKQHGEYAASCFQAEQAAQLALKALLHGLGAGDRALGHGLIGLGRALEDTLASALPDDILDSLARLSRHYIATRYPDAIPEGLIRDHFRASDADQAELDAESVVRLVGKLWADAAGADPRGGP